MGALKSASTSFINIIMYGILVMESLSRMLCEILLKNHRKQKKQTFNKIVSFLTTPFAFWFKREEFGMFKFHKVIEENSLNAFVLNVFGLFFLSS